MLSAIQAVNGRTAVREAGLTHHVPSTKLQRHVTERLNQETRNNCVKLWASVSEGN